MTRQRGDIMLVTLVFLLLCLLGLVVSMRDSMINTTMNGNNLARQKDVQVADIALRQLETQVLAAYGGQALELSASGQPWWRNVAAGTAAPTGTYWDSCLGNATDSARCGAVSVAVNGSALNYTALAVVQPTGRSDSTSCDLAQFQAVYYDLYVHVKESNGVTAVNTETVYRICTSS